MRINQYPLESSPADNEVFVIDGAGGTKSLTIAELRKYIIDSGNLSGGSGTGAADEVDYVIRESDPITQQDPEMESTTWCYRVWKSGLKECWINRKYTFSTVTANKIIYTIDVNFPFTFSQAPITMGNFIVGGDDTSHATHITSNTTRAKMNGHATNQSGSGECYLAFYCIGV